MRQKGKGKRERKREREKGKGFMIDRCTNTVRRVNFIFNFNFNTHHS